MAKAAVAMKPVEASTSEDDAFAAAFSELASMGKDAKASDDSAALSKVVAVEESPPVVIGQPEQLDLPLEEPKNVVDAAPTAEPEPVIEEPVADAREAAPEPAKVSDEDLLNKFTTLIRAHDEAARQAAPQPQPQQHYQPQPEPEIYAPEEKAFLNQYVKDWPDIVKAEALIRRSEYRDLANYIFSQFAQHMVPVQQTLQAVAERSHLSDLEAQVNDYGDIRDKVINWAAQQPAYLQGAYSRVIQQGTTEEVVDLISRYRASTGANISPNPVSAPAPKAEPKLSDAAKQAAAALAPVRSKRTATSNVVDPQDFESAFSQFAQMK